MFWLLFSVFQISLCSLVKVHKNAKALSILNIKKTVKMHVFHLLAASMARVGGTVFEGQMAVGCTSFSLGKLIELKASTWKALQSNLSNLSNLLSVSLCCFGLGMSMSVQKAPRPDSTSSSDRSRWTRWT